MCAQKKIAEIASGIREAVKFLGDDVPYVVPAVQMRRLADELDAASKRDAQQKYVTDGLVVMHDAELGSMRRAVDTAKLRDALVEIARKLNSLDENCAVDPVEIRDLARAALSDPPRNCDAFSYHEAEAEFQKVFGRPWNNYEDELACWLFSKRNEV